MKMIDDLVSGGLSVAQFHAQYYTFYLESIPEDAMSDSDYEFFGQLQEKLDWTDLNPSSEDRLWGWISYEEYKDWAVRKHAEYLSASEP